MRALLWHVSAFRAEVTERGRSSRVEPPEPKVIATEEAILVLAAAEQADQPDPRRVGSLAGAAIASHARQLGVQRVALLPFAHLFVELAPPETAVAALEATLAALRANGLAAERAPFGWFHTLEIRAKGHPLSRVARTWRLER